VADINRNARPTSSEYADIETDVVVARLGTAGFSGTQGLIPFGRSPLVNQAKEERSYEEYMAR
jgi:chromate transport protein ChrA